MERNVLRKNDNNYLQTDTCNNTRNIYKTVYKNIQRVILNCTPYRVYCKEDVQKKQMKIANG